MRTCINIFFIIAVGVYSVVGLLAIRDVVRAAKASEEIQWYGNIVQTNDVYSGEAKQRLCDNYGVCDER